MLVVDTIANFLFFAPVYILTSGGPAGSTNLLMFQAYQAAFVCMGGLTLASTWVFWQLSPASVMHHSIENETLTQATPD